MCLISCFFCLSRERSIVTGIVLTDVIQSFETPLHVHSTTRDFLFMKHSSIDRNGFPIDVIVLCLKYHTLCHLFIRPGPLCRNMTFSLDFLLRHRTLSDSHHSLRHHLGGEVARPMIPELARHKEERFRIGIGSQAWNNFQEVLKEELRAQRIIHTQCCSLIFIS